MQLRPGDRLLLDEQAGANFDFSADTERIDALIADGLLGVRAHDLPVIVFRAVIYCLHGFAARTEAEEIQASVGAQVGDIENRRGSRGVIEQRKFRSGVAEPD